MSIQESRDFVLEQAKLNVEFIKASPSNVGQAKQINTALANIVAMERNVIMHNALQRLSNKGPRNENLQNMSEH